MTRYTPLWEQAGSYAASVDRRLIGTIWPTAYVSGCLVTVAAGTMNMNIAAGAVVAPASNNTGSVLCYSDAVEVVTSPTAPGSGTNRYDVVVCQPRGNDLDGGSNNDFIFSVVSGTASASPTVPATPAGAVAIAQVLVIGASAALSSANLTDLRPVLAAPRAILNRTVLSSSFMGIGAGPPPQTLVTTPSLYIPANRRIVLVGHVYAEFLNNGGYLCGLMDGAVVTGRFGQYNNIVGPASIHGETDITPAAGVHTFGMAMAAIAGTCNARGDQEPGWLEVRDWGPV